MIYAVLLLLNLPPLLDADPDLLALPLLFETPKIFFTTFLSSFLINLDWSPEDDTVPIFELFSLCSDTFL